MDIVGILDACNDGFDLKIKTKLINIAYEKKDVLLPKLFWPTVRKICSSDREKLLKFEAEGQDHWNNLFKHCKVRTIFVPGGFSYLIN